MCLKVLISLDIGQKGTFGHAQRRWGGRIIGKFHVTYYLVYLIYAYIRTYIDIHVYGGVLQKLFNIASFLQS